MLEQTAPQQEAATDDWGAALAEQAHAAPGHGAATPAPIL